MEDATFEMKLEGMLCTVREKKRGRSKLQKQESGGPI